MCEQQALSWEGAGFEAGGGGGGVAHGVFEVHVSLFAVVARRNVCSSCNC